MLVLTRKEGQRIQIGNGIFVVIQRIRGGRVVLGVEAPQSVVILRDELPRADDRNVSTDAAAAGTADRLSNDDRGGDSEYAP
jgi:carbon storage regulator